MTHSFTKHRIEVKTFRNRHQSEKPILEIAMQFFLDELLKRCTIRHKLNVKVVLRNGPVKSRDDASINDGLAWEHESNGEKWFHIHLNDSVPFLELLSTLAHETVHVVQFATGRLRIDENDNWLWEGTNYGPNPYKGIEVIDTRLPWEYDAYSKEIDLARRFVKHYYSVW
jgi:hypothetical protein